MKLELTIFCEMLATSNNNNNNFENGRYKKVPVDERFCFNCDHVVENEFHFLFECPVYDVIRNILLTNVQNLQEFHSMSYSDKFSYLCSHHTRQIAKYVCNAYSLRHSIVYSQN